GMVAGDSLTVANASGSFSDKNAATGKTVTVSGISLGGADAGNYTLASSTATTTADISRATIASVGGITA
ncbi:YDG domain-containing protein, partial [Comamonas testosteroni]